MSALMPEISPNTRPRQTVLRLTVNNHPGVMSHICGLFSRRAYNVEGILCMPIENSGQSQIWLLVSEDQRLDQMIKQVRKLQDVIDIKRNGIDENVFRWMERFFQTAESA